MPPSVISAMGAVRQNVSRWDSPANLSPMLSGLVHHLLFTLKLNFRSMQAIVYGYLVPIFFLIAFGTLFRWGKPPLLGQMGELLTISALGGACFGMPTGMVSDRERGVWRRYRLLPASTAGLVVSTMLARFVLIASAAVLQILLARICYGTWFPRHPLELLLAFCFVAFSFEGMGLVIAAAADSVPAVQALGMAVFLPMIMIGGVGVPLATLPVWAQKLAGFLPGRYAVEALQSCIDRPAGLASKGFALIALLVIGIAGCVAGARLFRWDANQQFRASARGWVLLAVGSWIAVGITASVTGNLKPVRAVVASGADEPWNRISDAQIQAIPFTGLPPDDGNVAPVARSTKNLPVPEDQKRIDQICQAMEAWDPGHQGGDAQRVRNYLSAASVADISEQDPLEAQIARAVFDRLETDFDKDDLIHILAYIVLNPNTGTVITDAPELDIHGPINADEVRQRDGLYALKLLGRLLGKLPE